MIATYQAPTLTPVDAVGAERLRQLQREGFCIIPDVAPPALIEHTRACAERAIATQDEERLARTRSPGTLIDSDGYPELADLIGNPAALDELHRMGFTDIKFWKAVIISKPPGGPRLYWHQDCMLWQDPRSYSEVPGMIFLMYYLEDTSRHNGCLRLLPGSHRRRLDLHDLGVAHERDINSMENAADPRFLDHEGEVDVPVRAGDLVVGDARMFHAAHSNESDQRRTVITIWFYPLFSQLLEPVQSYYHSEMHRKHAEWPPHALAKIAPPDPAVRGRRTADGGSPHPRRAAARRLKASEPLDRATVSSEECCEPARGTMEGGQPEETDEQQPGEARRATVRAEGSSGDGIMVSMHSTLNEFPPSKAPRFPFAETLPEQEDQLRRNPLLQRMRQARREKADDRYRPRYHYVSPEFTLNDPNGLCFWQGRWHLFYQARPPEDPRQHWGHAVSPDLVHWRDLPYAIGPGPEERCYSGTALVEDERVIAMYHGVGVGNMVAVSHDPLLLNWRKVTGGPVLPFGSSEEPALPYGVFDPCIWKKDGAYYALSAGIVPFRPDGMHTATNYLFRSRDLENWEYLHPFVEGGRFTRLGDDGACPYFWPIGDRHILVFFSHVTGGQYLLGDYDTKRDKFLVDAHGLFTFGPVFPGGVHAPTAFPDGEGGVIVMCNMNPAKPTGRMDNYLAEFFGAREGWLEEGDGSQFARDWDQILTLPRRLTLRDRYEVEVEPAGDIASLRSEHRHVGRTVVAPNRELVLEDVAGDALELSIEVEPKHSSLFEVDVLRSPGREEYTRICLYHRRGMKYREPFPDDARSNRVISTSLSTPARYESVITIDNSCSSTLPDVLARPPESAPVLIEPGEPVRLRIFVDRSVVEVFVNGRQCVAVRVYPGRRDSTGVSLISRGQESVVRSLDCWQMRSIYGRAGCCSRGVVL